MATITLCIPVTAFGIGKPFEEQNPNKFQIAVPLQDGAQEVITTSTKTYEDWQFHPNSSDTYNNILRMVKTGILEIRLAGVIQTPQQLITMFKSFYQEL